MNNRPLAMACLLTAILLSGTAWSQPEIADLDAFLVRGDTHDILVVRPWLPDLPTAGVWTWPVPAGTEVAICPEISIDALRSAVWAGHIPLSPTNAQRLKTSCDARMFMDEQPLPLQALGTVDSLDEFDDIAATAGLPLTADDRSRCATFLAYGASVAVVGWQDADPKLLARNHLDATPLAAVALTTPGYWDAVDLGAANLQRGCTGRFIAVARRPVVPAPEDRDRWQVSLLRGHGTAEVLEAARLAGASDVDDMWCATALDLQHCDGESTLHPVLLELPRDLRGPTARTAASWCGLHPGADAADALRSVLGVTDPQGMESAFTIWAWARQQADDVAPVLAAWADCPDQVVRSEALLGLSTLDGADGLERDLATLAAFVEPSRDVQGTVDQVGSRIVASIDMDGSDELNAIADAGGGWLEWCFGEQIDELHRKGRLSGRHGYRPGTDELTAGAWAVAALAVLADCDAFVVLPDALVVTAILRVAATDGRRRGCSVQHGITSDFWNGFQILIPRNSSRQWPTLHRLEVALAEQPRVRNGLLRQALRDPRLPDVAATVLLASVTTWTPADEAMAVAILDSAATAADEHATRFFGVRSRGTEVDVRLPWAAAGAAYVLAQRGVTAPILAALERDPEPALRGELVFALALAPRRAAAEKAAMAAWRADVDLLADDDPQRLAADLAAERMEAVRPAGRRSHRPYQDRFTADFRTRWRR